MRFFHSKLRVVGVSLVFLFAATASVSAQSRRQPPAFHITAGVVDDQVLQRDSNDRADIALSGLATSRGAATVESRVLRRHRLVEGFDWAEAASVGKGGEWQASIKGNFHPVLNFQLGFRRRRPAIPAWSFQSQIQDHCQEEAGLW